MATYIMRRDRIPEYRVPGKRLGRNITHDSRSLLYLVAERYSVANVLWPRNIPILDQGDVGSCTGNAETGALGSGPLYAALPAGHPALDESLALRLYSAAEVIDGDGPYPPNDNGSSGLSVSQAAKAAGFISGYQHATTLAAMQSALQAAPVIIGINWYDSFDSPAADGLITISRNAEVRGGHEVLVRGVDFAAGQFHADNSWGSSWGVAGSFLIGFDTMSRLLSEDGDCTAPVPLSVQPPQPTPAPVVTHPDRDFGHDPQMLAWAAADHIGGNAYAAHAYLAWRAERGYR